MHYQFGELLDVFLKAKHTPNLSGILLLGIIIIIIFETEFRSCYPGWSAMA